MKLPLCLIILFIVPSCTENNNTFLPYENGIIDTRNGKIYQLQYKGPDFTHDYIKVLDSIKVTDILSGTITKYPIQNK